MRHAGSAAIDFCSAYGFRSSGGVSEQVLTNARALLDKEATQLAALRNAHTAAEVRAASSGGTYTEKKP